jgi:tetratricopeptide (TPR) repeat protein
MIVKQLPALLLALLLAAGACARAAAADRPSSEQWAGVAQAITAQDASAEDKVLAITTAFPAWSEGFRTLAQLQLKRKAYAETLTSATKALSLDKVDSAAAACAVQALGALGRNDEAFALADQFSGAKDPQGWVNFHAAAAGLAAKDRTKAELYLKFAFARVQDPPAEFTYLDARIAESAGDDKRAALSLTRATAANTRFWDAWYELGAVQARLSEGAGDKAIEWLQKSEASFTKVVKAQEKDYQAWQGLGSTQLKLSQALKQDSPGDSLSKAREAATSLDTSLTLKEDQRDAHLGLGQALLLIEDYERAIPHLERAAALGAQDRALTTNLMLAYQKTGKTAKFEEAARSLKAVSPSEKITMGMGLYHAGQLANAAELLASATGDLNRESDRERLGAVYRILGHAHADLAEQARSRLAAAPSEQKQALQALTDKELDAARDAYREGGGLRDYPARHAFLALESQRSFAAGYDAGWQYLAWSSYVSPDGWAVVIGNYGGAMTGGNGLGGMWNHHPMHVVAWGLAALIPLIVFITSLFSRRETLVEPIPEAKRRPTVQSAPPPPPPAKNRTPQPGPPPARNRTPHPGPPPAKNRTPQPGPPPAKNRTPQPGAKAVTEVAARIKSETEPSVTAVHMPTRTKSADSGDASALERRPVAKPSSSQRRPPPTRP